MRVRLHSATDRVFGNCRLTLVFARDGQTSFVVSTHDPSVVEAAELYAENPVALNLRAMNMLYESIVKRGSLMVVPSGLADSLNLPGIMGMAGAAGVKPPGADTILDEPVVPEEERPPRSG